MRDIVYGPNGPEGSETIEFTRLGVRFAILGANGKLTAGSEYSPEMLGGTIPVPGDRFTTLWQRDDPDDADLFEVISRHYVGEFDGDNCWWIIVKPIVADPPDRALYKLARSASTRNRKGRLAREKAAARVAGVRLGK
ncbi:hypothetical protein KD146_13435 [Devosia sp. BSSL-BM10]|uniref:Uncharacterized protein n=1 Tax=Devosia litorisediminis TaxID=2829817 RepID=A0A942E8V5_9HYPH|nr:hypothetical protein [Devosia litorisediminis]MBS3849701.1 hypothetical protein [Devosia litorisediminis]